MADTQIRPQSAPAATAPRWRACLARALQCWFGGLALMLVMVPMFTLGDVASVLTVVGAFLLLMLAIAVISTLAALVIESLTAPSVPIGGHIGLIALAGLIVVGLFSGTLGFAIAGLVACLVGATLGALISIGEPTWRRYAITLGLAVAIHALQLAVS